MTAQGRDEPSRIQKLSYVVMWWGVAATAGAGINAYLLSTRTDEFFAWTIRNPLTAAFFGAGYSAATVAVALSLLQPQWARLRLPVVVTLNFVTVMAVATLRDLDTFRLRSGPTFARMFAWEWLGIYLSFPVLAAIVLVRQERAGGAREYEIREPLLPWFRMGLLGLGIFNAVIALGLWIGVQPVIDLWPWTLPPLAAHVTGAWLITAAASELWTVREGDWDRVRIYMSANLLFWVLEWVAVLRFPDSLPMDSAKTWLYLGFVTFVLFFQATGVIRQEMARRGRAGVPAPSSSVAV